MKILVFGNKLVEKDNLALKIMPKLQELFPEIQFKEFDPTESLEKETENKNLNIIDVAEGINKVRIINNLNQLETIKPYSMHDFDLAYNLKLLKKINLIDNVNIICIPIKMQEQEAIAQTQLILRKWVAQLIQGS